MKAGPLDAESLARLQALHEASPLLIALFDPSDQLRYANPAFRAAYDVEAGESLSWSALMRRNHARGSGARIQTDDIERWLATALSRRGKQPFRAFEADLHGGRWVWMTETLDPRGWMLCVASDITVLHSDQRMLRQAHAVAQRAALTDPLTHISNREHILQLFEQAVAAAKTSAAPCCVAIIDLDHFKSINDRYGHLFGDLVLVDFARRTQKQLRRGDGFGRLGGEEFMVVLADTALDQAQTVLERLARRISQPRPLADLQQFRYTLSCGVTRVHADDAARAVYLRADLALYEAKRLGRDRVQASA